MRVENMEENVFETGRLLISALETDELAALLEQVLVQQNVTEIDLLLEGLDENIANVVYHYVDAAVAPEEPDAETKAAFDEWDKLWGEWSDKLSKIGDGDGPYMINDHEWKPPHFNPGALLDDLETISAKMSPLVNKVSGYGAQPPDLFIEALKELEECLELAAENRFDEIEVLETGPQLTQLVLLWQYLTTFTPRKFIESILKAERELGNVRLKEVEITGFFQRIPAETRQEFYTVQRDEES